MKMHKRYLAVFLMLLGMLPAGGCAAKAVPGDVKLYCLNIGKADCMILCCADQYYLIDTGYEHTYAALQTALSSLNIDHLDGVFLTHCHEDHAGGLMKLAQSPMEIDHFYGSSIYHDVKEKKHPLRLAAQERSMEVEWLSSGDVIEIADGYAFSILGPVQTDTENENNNSLVMYFSSPHGSILFAGDMKDEEENDLLYHKLLQPSDVLKVGHHGDNGATSKAFLSTVAPRCAIILTSSVQEPDTPSPKALFRMSSIGCDTYVSQDAQDAYCITLRNREISVQDIAWPDIPKRITTISMIANIKENTLQLTNNISEPLLLSGCSLYLSKNDAIFPLDDITLAPGASYIIGGKKAEHTVDMRLDTKKLLDEKKLDSAILCDGYGRIVAICNNGKNE